VRKLENSLDKKYEHKATSMFTLMMETEDISETMVFNLALTALIALEGISTDVTQFKQYIS
jgi:hypothetical protein